MTPINGRGGAEAPDKADTVFARGSGEHPSATQSRKLHRQAAYSTRSTVDDERLTRLDVEGVINSLQRRKRAYRHCARVFEVDAGGNMADGARRDRNVLCIEAATNIVPNV